MGINFQYYNRDMNTDEFIITNRSNSRELISQNPDYENYDTYFGERFEDKVLQWNFNVDLTEVHIPIIFTWDISKTIELMFGINRRMATWKIKDVTLETYNYWKEIKDSVGSEKYNLKRGFYEPVEKRTEVETTFISGVTVTPSNSFNVRLLIVPNFRDEYDETKLRNINWWIGINFYPFN